MKSEKNRNLIISLVGALIIVLLCGKGLFESPDMWLQDKLFQRPVAVPDDIVIIGVTERDFQAFGPYSTWGRSVMASALEALGADPENRPAVVAMDFLYQGETDPAEDQRLADAAENLGCVITATKAGIGTQYSFGSDKVVVNDRAVLSYEEPYQALKDVSTQGHINAMYDDDGVLRHAILYVEPEGRKVYSMAFQAASMYAGKKGITISEPPVDEVGQYFVTFSAEPSGFYEGVSLCDLINGNVPSSYFSGKLVLIGPYYAAGLSDFFTTAISRGEYMYGIEYQANVIQCILDGNYKTQVPDYIQLMVLGLVCFAFLYFVASRRLLVAVPILFAFAALGIGGSVMLFSAGYITHVFWIPFGVLVLFIVAEASNYIRAAIARQHVTKTFERYVAPSIVGEILKEGTDSLKLGGKLCDIAVLFVDIRGFTTMSERLSPEEVVHILNQYLSMTSACIEKNKGTLDKFVGDATMAFWGAPLPEEDPVYLAAKTALDIVEGADALSAKLKEEINEELHVGVGVHYGPAVVGNMGSEKRMDYTAIGDTVNTAARLEANAPGGTVYISRAVADALKGRMKFESLGDSIRLKGKAEGFEVLKLTGPEE